MNATSNWQCAGERTWRSSRSSRGHFSQGKRSTRSTTITDWSFFGKDQIRIGKDEILARQLTLWGATEGESVRCADVETVRIGKEDGRGMDGVVLETDGCSIKVGDGLSAESLEWLKNCIMRVIST